MLEESRPRRSISVALQWSMIGFSLIWSCVLVAYCIRSVIGADVGSVAFYTPNDLVTIRVQPNAPAEHAGVRDGDRVDAPAMTLHDRLIFLGGVNVAGQPATLAVRRNGAPMTFRYRLDRAPMTPAAIFTRLGFVVSAIIALLFSTIVLGRAPTGDAACLWLFSLLWVSSAGVTTFLPGALAVADLLFNDVTFAAGLTGALLLAVHAAGAYWTRDRNGERLALSEAVRLLTRDTAEALGLTDRGVLAPGKIGDLNVIDYDALQLRAPVVQHDLPAGGARLLQPTEGYVATVKSGQIVFRDGQPTGAHPGTLIRA